MGISSARAGDEPPVELWRQQTIGPNLSLHTRDVAGRLRDVTYVDIDGHAVTEGDISLGRIADVARGRPHFPGVLPGGEPPPPGPQGAPQDTCTPGASGAAVSDTSALWPKGRVPYVFDPGLPAAVRKTVEEAVADFTAGTCVRFVPRTDVGAFVRIFAGTGCYSMLGMKGGRQDLSLGSGCNYMGTVVHELMHVIGFHHEHNRSDRDGSVDVHLENVTPAYHSQFQRMEAARNRLFGDFDQNSVMIYGNRAFSANGLDTLVAKNGRPLTDPYAKTGFSAADLIAIRQMYGC
ncbi:M12 family metallopeptidase [Actinomadura sp. HBU206391]|uniref:M12 family metallopeptidase n=1 Tax=Actinomadura sp. HBU206391 TaxID=2731692 RepID=UPI00164F15E4|nr:M12 family metallopeptidase [Actinomadura sp. HBU206391]MBC6457717.1 hypothetical protein [Actinomadura sp. HBU206391]